MYQPKWEKKKKQSTKCETIIEKNGEKGRANHRK